MEGGSCAFYVLQYTLRYDASAEEYARPGEYTETFITMSNDHCPLGICKANATVPAHIYPCIMLPYDESFACGIGMRYYTSAIYHFPPEANTAFHVIAFFSLSGAF